MKRALGLVVLCLFLFLGIFTAHRNTRSYEIDPDRFYHFALSREMVKSGSLYLREVPQVADLGWGKYFPDKEFFFHQITALGYRLGQDQGVIYAVLACFGLAVSAFFLYGASALHWFPALLVTLATFGLPVQFFRMLSVRPHVVAVLFFVLLNLSILRRKRWGIFAAAFFYALSYHAFYLALVCLGVLGVASYFRKPEERKRQLIDSAAGIGGVVAGLLVNPHFPSNLILAYEISRIPSLMAGKLSTAIFGSELYPFDSIEFLHHLLWPMAICFVGLLFLGQVFSRWRAGQSVDWRWFYLSPLALFFLLLCFQTRRAVEYLVPVAGLLLVLILEQIKSWQRREFTLAAFGFFGFAGLVAGDHLAANRISPNQNRAQILRGAIQAIPEGAEKIYNCEWDTSPALYYYRPDLNFVDIMDPSLLYFHREDAFYSRESLRVGKVGDARNLLKNAFGASYALCQHPEIRAQLEAEPGVRRIFPKTNDPTLLISYGLYEIQSEEVPNFVRAFRIGLLPQASSENFTSLQPTDAEGEPLAEDLGGTNFLNLFPVAAKSLKQKPNSYCALVSPAFSELSRLAGATHLSLGGGRNLRLWVNGKLLYESRSAFVRAQSSQVIVPLPKALSTNDKVEVLVCSGGDAPFWGVALSAWTIKEIENTCRWKRLGVDGNSSLAAYSGREAATCLGPLAVPTVSPALSAQ